MQNPHCHATDAKSQARHEVQAHDQATVRQPAPKIRPKSKPDTRPRPIRPCRCPWRVLALRRVRGGRWGLSVPLVCTPASKHTSLTWAAMEEKIVHLSSIVEYRSGGPPAPAPPSSMLRTAVHDQHVASTTDATLRFGGAGWSIFCSIMDDGFSLRCARLVSRVVSGHAGGNGRSAREKTGGESFSFLSGPTFK